MSLLDRATKMMYAEFFVALAAWSLPVAAAIAEDNAVFDELLTRGVALGEVTVRLPAPTLADGLSPPEQQKALATVADANHPLPALLRNAVVAPLVLKIKDEPSQGTVRPRRVDLWFVVYGDFDQLGDEDFLIEQANEEARGDGQESPENGHILSADELRARGIAARSGESYLGARFTLFDRVQLSATMRTMLTRNADSIIMAGKLDPRFDAEGEFPNAWRSIKRDAAGRAVLDPPRPYTGMGWFAKATKLAVPLAPC